MNKNRRMKHVVAASLAFGAAALTGFGQIAPAAVYAAEQTETVKTESTKSGEQADEGLFKEETVYVNADANGAVKLITVSDWLKNAGTTESLKDVSELDGIKNIKGEVMNRYERNNVVIVIVCALFLLGISAIIYFFFFYDKKHCIFFGKKSKKTFFCPWHMKKILLNLHYLIQVIHKHFPQDHIFVPAGFCSFSLSARSRSAWETRRYSGICSIAVSVRPSL